MQRTEKWRLALEMPGEMTWLRQQHHPPAGTGNRDWQYVVAVRGTTSAYSGDAQPVIRSPGSGPSRPPKQACPAPSRR